MQKERESILLLEKEEFWKMGKLSFLRGIVKPVVICDYLSQCLIGSSEEVNIPRPISPIDIILLEPPSPRS